MLHTLAEKEHFNMERAVAIIDLLRLKNNIINIKSILTTGTKLMAVVKADGYGHGVMHVAETSIKGGAELLGVAIIDEALEIRNGGIYEPILILGHTPPNFYEQAIKNDISMTVFDYESGVLINEIADKLNKTADIHIKIDTGMARIGFLVTDKSIDEIHRLSELKNLNLSGIYTHLANSDDEDKSFCYEQKDRFFSIIDSLGERNVFFQIKHISNSGATLSLRDFDLDMVRTGIIMYGLCPCDADLYSDLKLKPVLSLKSYVSHVKEWAADSAVGYGRSFTPDKKIIVATIPMGYADGFSRAMSNRGKVIINGQFAPIIGRICMDQFMVDATDISGICVGMTAILIGEDNGLSITADDLAVMQNTINYEVLCNISKRVRRKYI